jgi:hypothetical protein
LQSVGSHDQIEAIGRTVRRVPEVMVKVNASRVKTPVSGYSRTGTSISTNTAAMEIYRP